MCIRDSPQAIRETIKNPDQSHVDEMLSFAEQANREYEAELYRQQAVPTPDDRETGETVDVYKRQPEHKLLAIPFLRIRQTAVQLMEVMKHQYGFLWEMCIRDSF